jgi:hypothetical protein
MPEDQEKELNRHFLTLWIIWGALLSSLVMYLMICQAVPSIRSWEGTDRDVALLRNILLGVSAAELLFLYFIRRAMFSPRARGPINRRVETDPLISKRVFMAKYSSIVIVSLAISESIGIYGLVLFILGDRYTTLYTFLLVSALAMVAFRPKAAELERLAVKHIFK